MSTVFSFQSRTLRVGPRQPMGRESTDRLCVSSANGSRWGSGDILCLSTVSRFGLSVLQPGPVRGGTLPCVVASSHDYLWPSEMSKQPLLPRNPPVRKRGLVGRHKIYAFIAKIIHGDQWGLRNHILPWSHSWWGVGAETATICLWK